MFPGVRHEIVHRLAHVAVALAALHGLKKRVDQIDQFAVVAVDQAASGVKIIGPNKLRHEISLRRCLQAKCGCAPDLPLAE
jgi:hypothetical protein